MRCLCCKEELYSRASYDRVRPSLRRTTLTREAGGEFMCPTCWQEVVGEAQLPRLDDSHPLESWTCCGLFYAEDPTPGRIVGRC